MAAFLSHLARTGNIHTLVESMEQSYGALNFRIAVPATNRSIYILQERDLITSLLRKQSKLPFVNRNFDLSHGHFNSINSVNTTDPLWTDLHYGLLEIVRAKKISPIMEKYKGLLTYVPAYNLNTQLEEFYLRVWSEYCLGPVDIEKYRQLRERLIAVLGHVFHKNPLNRWPWLGHVSSRWNHWRYRAELQQVDEELRELLAESIAHREGLFYELYDRLRGRYPNAFQIAVDNSFLGVLVYDFVYIIMADALAHIAQDPSLDRGEQVKQSRHDGFLYPFRFRRVDEDDDGFKVGDFAIYNLQKAGLYFSAGLRFCPGASLFQEISTKTLEILSDVKITEVQPGTPIVRSPNRDLPFMLSSHEVAVECPYQQSARPEEKE
jgi:hypothetical protein